MDTSQIRKSLSGAFSGQGPISGASRSGASRLLPSHVGEMTSEKAMRRVKDVLAGTPTRTLEAAGIPLSTFYMVMQAKTGDNIHIPDAVLTFVAEKVGERQEQENMMKKALECERTPAPSPFGGRPMSSARWR